MIIGHYDINDLTRKRKLLWWQERGRSFTVSGYGKRIPTRWMVKLPNLPGWRRVYCCIYSNVGTCYVEVGKDRNWVTISGVLWCQLMEDRKVEGAKP